MTNLLLYFMPMILIDLLGSFLVNASDHESTSGKYLMNENSTKPVILSHYPDIVQTVVSDHLIVPCIVRGSPMPDVSWYYRNSIVSTNATKMSRVYIKAGVYRLGNVTYSYSLLNIKPVTQGDDQSTIRCHAENVIEKNVWSNSSTLRTVPASSRKPLNSTKTGRYEFGISQRDKIKCPLEGDLRNGSFLIWLKESSPISLPISTTTLNITDSEEGMNLDFPLVKIQDGGNYQCILLDGNSLRTSPVISVHIIDPPEKPDQLKVWLDAPSDKEINLFASFQCQHAKRFLMKAKSLDTKFPWQYHELYTEMVNNFQVNLTMMLPDVQPNTKYEVQMFSLNSFGHMNPSTAVVIETLDKNVVELPHLVYVTMKNMRMLQISWQNPIFSKELSINISGQIRESQSKSWRSFGHHLTEYATISHLNTNKPYQIRLVSLNSFGRETKTDPFSFITAMNSTSKLPELHIQQVDERFAILIWPNMTGIIGNNAFKIQINCSDTAKSFQSNVTRVLFPHNGKRISCQALILDIFNGRTSYMATISHDDAVTKGNNFDIELVQDQCIRIEINLRKFVSIFTNNALSRADSIVLSVYELIKNFDTSQVLIDWSNINQMIHHVYNFSLNSLQTKSQLGLHDKFILCGLLESVRYTLKVSLNNSIDDNGYMSLPIQMPSPKSSPERPENLTLTLKCSSKMPCIHSKWDHPSMKPVRDFPGFSSLPKHLIPLHNMEASQSSKLFFKLRYRAFGISEETDGIDEVKSLEKWNTIQLRQNEFTTPESDIWIGAEYEVIVSASNEVGESYEISKRIKIPEQPPSDAPADWIYRKVSEDKIVIRWLPPPLNYRRGKITSYQLRNFIANRETDTENIINVTSTNYTIYAPEVPILFYIRALNSAGPGPWTDKILIEPPLSIPDNVSGIRMSPTSILVTFSVKSIEKYLKFIIWYSTTDSAEREDWSKVLTNGPVTDYTITNLRPSSDYYIRVSGVNLQEQESQWSGQVFVPKGIFRMPNVLPDYKNVASSSLNIEKFQCLNQRHDTIIVTWNSPNRILKESIEIKVVGYREYLSELGQLRKEKTAVIVRSGQTLDFHELAQGLYHVVIGHLLPNTKYDITLAVKGAFLNYNTQCSTLWTVPNYVPTPELSLIDIDKDDSNQIRVRIFRVSEEYGPIHNYYLIVRPDEMTLDQYISDNQTPSQYTFNLLSFNANLPSEQAPYIALDATSSALFPNTDQAYFEFVLGSQKNSTKIRSNYGVVSRNKYLNPQIYYRMALRACIEISGKRNCKDSKWSERFITQAYPKAILMSDGVGQPRREEFNNPHVSSLKQSNKILISILASLAILACFLMIVGCFIKSKTKTGRRHFLMPTDHNNNQITQNDFITQNEWFVNQNNPNVSNGQIDYTGALIANTKTTPIGSPNVHEFSSLSVNSANNSMHHGKTSSTGYNYIGAGMIRNANYNDHTMKASRSITQFSGSFGNPGSDSGTGTVFQMTGIGSNAGLGMVEEVYNVDSPMMDKNNYSLAMKSNFALSASQLTEFLIDYRLNCQIGPSKHYENPKCSTYDLEYEFKKIENASNVFFQKEATVSASAASFNRSKNRFPNLSSVFDHSRVILRSNHNVPIFYPGNDYINSNYVDGNKMSNCFIAAETPMKSTLGNFWQMIWEQNVKLVIRLTEQCEIDGGELSYLPTRGTLNFKGFLVTLVQTFQYANYFITRLRIEQKGEMREIWHATFTDWPVGSVPQSAGLVLNFIRKISSILDPNKNQKQCKVQLEENSDGPILVNCLNGVCRTGTFIAICNGLHQVQNDKFIDIYGLVKKMRLSRNGLIASLDQYIFVYRSIAEFLVDGNTEIYAKDLNDYVNNLALKRMANVVDINCVLNDPSSSESGFQMEFKKLKHLMHTLPNEFYTDGQSPCLKRSIDEKNRIINLQPFKHNRVILDSIRGVATSDYINASFIDGYLKKEAFIITQAPLCNTIEDFWRMLWQHQSNIIVMLCQKNEHDKMKSICYWPTETMSKYQYFVIECISEYTLTDYILREFKMTDVRSGETRTIRQFQFLSWSDNVLPFNGQAILDLIFQINKTKEQFGLEGPITVHCNTGGSRCGIYVCLSNILERLQLEPIVDVYQVVKILQSQRAQMISTEEHYQFCYKIIANYLRIE